jgi:hypothetical protein
MPSALHDSSRDYARSSAELRPLVMRSGVMRRRRASGIYVLTVEGDDPRSVLVHLLFRF